MSRKARDFKTTAVQDLQRARRSLIAPDAETDPRTGLLIQSSIAYGLLDLADAIRAHAPQEPADGDRPGEGS